jgi:phage-related minor tail protein
MDYINPISGTVLPAGLAQQQAATAKVRQIRQAQAARRNVAADGDRLVHAVENAEEVAPTHDEPHREGQAGRHPSRGGKDDKHPDDNEPHVDVTG